MSTSSFRLNWPANPKLSRAFNKSSTRYPASTLTIGVGRHASPSDAVRSPTQLPLECWRLVTVVEWVETIPKKVEDEREVIESNVDCLHPPMIAAEALPVMPSVVP